VAYRNGVTPTDITGKTVKSLSIVFDEGQDALGGPISSAWPCSTTSTSTARWLAEGPSNRRRKDRDESEGEDKDHRHHPRENSSSRPESSRMSYEDRRKA